MATKYIFRQAFFGNLGWYRINTGYHSIRSLVTKASDINCSTDPVLTENRQPLKTGDSISVNKLITVEDVDEFCKLTGDFNTVHTQSRIVHGALLNGLVSGVMGTMLPGPGCMVLSQTLNYPQSCVAPVSVTVTVSVTTARKIICCEFNCCTPQGVTVLHGEAKLIMKNKVPL